MEVKIISSHFKEDLSWVYLVKYPVEVYSKTIKDKNYISFNKVQEAPAYLKYIINNYNNLPDYSIFVHGHLNSQHQDQNIIDKINSIEFNKPIINLNRPDWTCNLKRGVDLWDRKFSWIENNWNDLVGDYLKMPDQLEFPACAQFAVHKSCITRHPIEFWQRLFTWCENTNLDNYVSSRIFEYLWYYFFSGKNIYIDSN